MKGILCFVLICCLLTGCLYPLGEGDKIPVPQLSPYLLKYDSLEDYFKIDEGGIKIYATKADKMAGKVECHIKPNEYAAFRNLFASLSTDSLLELYQQKGTKSLSQAYKEIAAPSYPYSYNVYSEKPLTGLRIAVDAGHIADDMKEAEIEGKYVKMRRQSKTNNTSIAFNEATLTLATAYLVKDQLEFLGATVMMTREEEGKSVRGMSFEEWEENNFQQDLSELLQRKLIDSSDVEYFNGRRADEKDRYAIFNTMDLRARAEKINAFHPHLTLIIHFNVDGPNYEERDRQGYIPPNGRNYLMAFIPGSILRRELEHPEQRLALLRMILTDDIEKSYQLAEQFILSSQRLTGVPLVKPEDGLAYLDRNSILTSAPGVYARNLKLNQLVNGPICYGESLCQDDILEARALNQRDFEVNGIEVPNRLMDVAKSYQRAVVRYARRTMSAGKVK